MGGFAFALIQSKAPTVPLKWKAEIIFRRKIHKALFSSLPLSLTFKGKDLYSLSLCPLQKCLQTPHTDKLHKHAVIIIFFIIVLRLITLKHIFIHNKLK